MAGAPHDYLQHKLFSFQGRLRRRDWWILSIACNLLNGVLTVLVVGAVTPPDADVEPWVNATQQPQGGFPLVAAIAIDALFLWPWLALTIKRRHDRGSPGWDAAGLVVLLTAVSWAPAAWTNAFFGMLGLGGLLVALGVLVAVIWLLVVLGFLDGQPGMNRYGLSPKAAAAQPTVAEEFN